MDGGQLIAKVIARQGVEFVFTLCGGHISPILSGCKKQGIRVIDVRHEVNAVFAADAVARLTGIPGVAAVTAGPGVTNTITAIKNAAMAQSPLVLLGGCAPTVLQGRGALQDIDQMSLMKPLCKWTTSISKVRQIVPALEEAFRKAAEGVPGPVYVECPIDILYDEKMVREWYGSAGGKNPKSIGQKIIKYYLNFHLNKIFRGKEKNTDPQRVKDIRIPMHSGADINRVAQALKKAKRPVFLIGSQAMLCTERVDELAGAVKKMGVPCYLSGMARGLLGASHELLNRHKRRVALKEADLVLLAGVPCDFRLEYGNHISRKARYISINRSRVDLNKNRRPDIGVLADAGTFLIALSGQVQVSGLDEWKNTLLEGAREREQDIDNQAEGETSNINPVRLFRDLNPMLAAESVLVADGGDFVGTASYTLHARGPLTWLDPGAFGTLGVGGGFALGAKLVRPEAEVWIIYGDGSSAYSLAEYDSFVRHKAPVISVVGNDACWAQIARDQIDILKDDVAVMLEHSDYDVVARGYGGEGIRVDNIAAFHQSVKLAKQAVANGKPFLINAIIGKTDFRKGSISV